MATPLFTEFPELADLSREDLEDLLNEPAYFQAVFNSLPRVKAMFQEQVELGLANESIAKASLEMQENLYKLRSETKEAFENAKALEARWKAVDKSQKEGYQRFTPQFLLLRLRHATSAQDDASEGVATSFVNTPEFQADPSGKDVDEFVKEFKELRKVYHKRVMWGDRWTAGKVVWRDD